MCESPVASAARPWIARILRKEGTAVAVLVALCLLIAPTVSGAKATPDVVNVPRQPAISPDYSNVTIPPNVAPLNFMIGEAAAAYRVRIAGNSGDSIDISSSHPRIDIPSRRWRL